MRSDSTKPQEETMDSIDLLDRALAGTAAIIDSIAPDDLKRSTPCDQWDVRTVIGHLIRGNQNLAAVAEGRPRNPDPIADPGDDPAAAYRDSAALALRAWRDHGDLDARFASPLGEMSGSTLLALRLADTVTHGWDLARATEQTPGYDEDVVRAAYEFAERAFPADRRPASVFAAPVPIDDARPQIDRLAAMLGRRA
jgi:uncharacterized protein (TIGR03086 family)